MDGSDIVSKVKSERKIDVSLVHQTSTVVDLYKVGKSSVAVGWSHRPNCLLAVESNRNKVKDESHR